MKETTSNPRMQNPDGIYASLAREEDYYSLRDYFAGLAMQGVQSDRETFLSICTDRNNCARDKHNDSVEDYIAQLSYRMADAMLKERLETN